MKITRMTFNPFQELTYVLWDEATHQCAIVDPGCSNEAEQGVLRRFIDDNHLTVEHMLLTHLHIDHCFGVKFVERTYGVTLTTSRGEEPLLQHMAEQARYFGLDFTDIPTTIGHYVEAGDTITIGNEEVHVIDVAGHSPGGVAYYVPQGGFVCCGDALFAGSIGRTDFMGGNYDRLIASLRNNLCTLPPHTVVYPGHGPETTIAHELRYNPYLQ